MIAGHTTEPLWHLAARLPPSLSGFDRPWAIAGGWALDLHLGHQTRRHDDLKIALLRRDQAKLREILPGWSMRAVVAGELQPWPPEAELAVPCHEIHGEAPDGSRLEILLNEAECDTWIYRRDARIRMPLAQAFWRSSKLRVPYLAPEVALLFKSKSPRRKDGIDFAAALPALSAAVRSWLLDALRLTGGPDAWIAQLSALGCE